jgi:adenylosuccinate synthase
MNPPAALQDAAVLRPISSGGALTTAVIGLQWGDEGKGKLVDILAPHHGAVVRFNGGANAGHSLVVKGERMAFHLVPCGVLHPGVRPVLGNGVVLDPEKLIEELEILDGRGVSTGTLAISDRAQIVMPYHKQEDALRERLLSREDDAPAIGTTGRGIGPAYAEKASRSSAVRAGDLLRESVLRERIENALRVKRPLFDSVGLEPPETDSLVGLALSWGERLGAQICDTSALLNGMLDAGSPVLFEGANATLLDVDHGTYPFVTSSNASAMGIPAGAGVAPRHISNVIGVVKAYCTRVGAGPFPTELHDSTGDTIRQRGREFGTTTGRPRRCGWLDLVALRYAVVLNGVDRIALTLLDVLSGFDELKVCTRYTLDGAPVDSFPHAAGDLSRVTPEYTTLAGFSGDLSGVRSKDDLPGAAQRYVRFIEDHAGVPIDFIGVGPDREQSILS